MNDSYFVNRSGKSIYAFKFNGVGLAYSSFNISEQASSLINSPSKISAISVGTESKEELLLYCNNDSLNCMQYQGSGSYAAFSSFEFEEDIEIKDISTIGDETFVLAYKGSYYFILKFESFDANNDITMDFRVERTSDGSGVVASLDAYESTTVYVIRQSDNYFYGGFQVSGNQINIDDFNADVYVGYLFDCEIELLNYFYGEDSFNYPKKISKLYVDYYNSQNFSVNGTKVPQLSLNNGIEIIKTGVYEERPLLGWFKDSSLSILQERSPYNLNITKIQYEITAKNL